MKKRTSSASGLITPSLDEMEYFLGEMTRLGLNLPVMIRGAGPPPKEPIRP